jgi:aspartate/methionine/tyrosine aminotransferase
MRPFLLERYLSKHEFSVRHVACASDPDTLRLADVLALEPDARDQFLSVSLGYTETKGSRALREAIASLYQGGVTADDVLVHVGAQEPIYAFMRATVVPGDHVICLTPTYQSLTSVAETIGAEVSRWEAHEANGWQPDVAELERLVRPNTRLLVLNTPQNPTGGLLTGDRYAAAMDFAASRGIRVLGDEVYRGLEHAGPRLPSVVELSERAVSLGAMAKVYGLAGLRIGWAVTRDRALLERLEVVKDYLSGAQRVPRDHRAAARGSAPRPHAVDGAQERRARRSLHRQTRKPALVAAPARGDDGAHSPQDRAQRHGLL